MAEAATQLNSSETPADCCRVSGFLLRTWVGNLVTAGAMLGLALLVALAGRSAWRGLRVVSEVQLPVCLAVIAAAVGATICVAGAMHFLAGAVEKMPVLPWYLLVCVRWPVEAVRRGLMVAELALMGVAVWFAATLVFGFKMPMPS